ALAAEVGGIGIAPGANLSDSVAMFEATHGTEPKYAGQDKVNPGSLILSAEMMLRRMGWVEAADLIIKGVEGAIANKTVTYDVEGLLDGAKLRKCSEFGDEVIAAMQASALPTEERHKPAFAGLCVSGVPVTAGGAGGLLRSCQIADGGFRSAY